MKEKIEKLKSKVLKKWAKYKSMEIVSKPYDTSDYSEVKTLNGYTTAWDNKDILWLLVNIEDGSYDGSGYQVGLNRDGKFVWEYQSHCSCNTFADSVSKNGDGELSLDFDMSKKSFELRELPDDWAKIVKVNLEEILKLKSNA